MSTILKNIVQFAGLVVGVPVSLPHGLNVNGVAVAPNIGGVNASGFTITADVTNVTVTRTIDALSGAANVYVEHWHTIEKVLPLPGQLAGLMPFFFSNGGGGAAANGWTDDGAVVRLTTAADQVSIGAALPIGAAALSVTGAAAVTNQTGSHMESLEAGGGLGGGRVSTDATGAGPGQGARMQGLDDTNTSVALVRAAGVGPGEGAIRLDATSALGACIQTMDGANWFAESALPAAGVTSLQMFPGNARLEVVGPGGAGETAAIQLLTGLGAGTGTLTMDDGSANLTTANVGTGESSTIAASTIQASMMTTDVPATGSGVVKTEPGFATLESFDTTGTKVSEVRVGVQVGVGEVVVGMTGNTIGFFGAVPVVQQGIPAVDAATPIGAALIALGLCYIAP